MLRADWRDAPPRLSEVEGSLLPRGCGRSYGDSCLNAGGTLVDCTGLDRFIDLGPDGVLRCEAGVTLAEVLDVVVPRGWFLPVVPGTKWVTVGGAIANDIHGKNHHHVGTFGAHVSRLELLRSTGERLVCSSEANPELFAATIGGLGLTGIILWAEIRLRRISGAAIEVDRVRFAGLDEFLSIAARRRGVRLHGGLGGLPFPRPATGTRDLPPRLAHRRRRPPAGDERPPDPHPL